MLSKKFLTFLLPLIVIANAGLTFAQAPAANRAAVEKQLLATERALNDAIAKGDMKTFHSNLAPDAISMDSGGIMKVDAEFDKMMASLKMQSWNIDSPQFYWVNDNTVVVMYKWTGKGTYQGQPVPSPTWASTVWSNKGGKWLAVFHQESAAMAPPTPPPAGGKK
jgi:hypothetical protein